MKNRTPKSLRFIPAALGLGFCLLAYNAMAANNYFGVTAGIANNGSYSWDAANWGTASGGPFTGNWTAGSFAYFTGGASDTYTVTVNATESMAGMYNTQTANTLIINDAGSGTGKLSIVPNGTLQDGFGYCQGFLTAGGTTTINCPIIGTGGIEQEAGGGHLQLFGVNTYTGGTLITSSSTYVDFNSSSSFGNGPLGFYNTTFAIMETEGGAPITLGNSVQILGGTTGVYPLLNAGAPLTMTGAWAMGAYTVNIRIFPQTSSSALTLTLSGVMSGTSAGSLNFSANATSGNVGTIYVGGANTYAGSTSIGGTGSGSPIVSVGSLNYVTSGTWSPHAASNLGAPGTTALGTIAIGATTVGGTLVYTGAGETTDRVINLAGTTGGATIEMDGAGPLVLTSAFTATGAGAKTLTLQGSSTAANTISGAIVNSSSATSLTKAQAGTWVLSGLNTYTGGTTISGGTLTIGGSGYLGGGSYAGAITDNGTFIYASSAAQTLSGTISGSGGLYMNNAAGFLALTGQSSYSGGTYIQSGVLQLGHATYTIPQSTILTFGGSGTYGMLDMAGHNQQVGGLVVASGATASSQVISNSASGSPTLTFNGGTSTFGGNIIQGSGNGTVALTVSAGSLTLSGANTYSGVTSISSGATLTIGSAGQLGGGTYAANITDNGTFIYNSSAGQTLSAIISGTGTLTQNGSGALTISGTGNSYAGITTINNGYLYIARDLSLGAAPTSSSAGWNSGLGAVPNQVTLNCSANNAGLRWSVTGFTLAASRGIYLSSGNIGGIGVSTGQSDTIAGPITGPGNFKSGFTYNTCLGTNILTAASGLSTYTGTTTIAGGRLMLGASGTLPSGTPLTIAADNGSGGVFDLGGFSQTIGTLTSSTGIGGTGGPGIPTIVLTGALTINETASTAFAGQILGSGGSLTLSASSTGTLTLSGVNTYTGLTTINGGTLDGNVAGSIPGNVTVTSTSGTALKLDSTTAMASTATLTLPASPAAGAVNLNLSGGTQTINALYFGSTPQATGTWGASGSGAANISSAFTGNGLLQVNCTAPAQTITPAAPAVCAGSTGNTASVSTTAGASYSWSITGGTITAGQTLSTVTYTAGAVSPVMLDCVVTASCGVPSAGGQNASVTVIPLPVTSAITGSGTVAINQLGQTYSVTLTSGSSYAWTVPSDASITAGGTGPNNNQITVNFGSASDNVTVTETSSASCVGAPVSLPVTVGPNHAPVAPAAKSLTTAMNTAATYNKVKLLVGATDADSDTLSVTAASTPAHGTTVLETDDVKYTPTTGYTGSDSYTYTISDGNGGTAIGTVNVIVTSNNGASPNVVGSPTFDSGTGTFSVTFAGIPGYEYTVEYAVGSAAPPWTKLENVIAGSDGLFTVTDGPGLSGSRYYRTVYPSY